MAAAAASPTRPWICSPERREQLHFARSVHVVFTTNDALTARARERYPELFSQGAAREQRLDNGDAAIVDDGAEPPRTLHIIERKTLADLNASRNDGRWLEQSTRIHATSEPGTRFTYAIEAPAAALFGREPTERTYGASTNQVLCSMLRNAEYIDGDAVRFTGDLDGMLHLVVEELWYKEATHAAQKPRASRRDVGPTAGGGASAARAQISAVFAKRSANATPHVHYLDSVRRIPGMGDANADVIVAEYQSPTALAKHLRAQGPNSLQHLPRIGKVLSQRVYEYALHRDPTTRVKLGSHAASASASAPRRVKATAARAKRRRATAAAAAAAAAPVAIDDELERLYDLVDDDSS